MFIYKVTNIISGKNYIGQTSRSIDLRWKEHNYTSSDGCRILKMAIKRYGKDNFKIEEIDGANSLTELNYKEWLWIHKLDCLYPNGYNLIAGGSNKSFSEESKKKLSNSISGVLNYQSKPVLCVELDRVFINCVEAADFVNGNRSKINVCCNGKKFSYKGYTWTWADKPTVTKKQTNKKKIYCVDLDLIFDSLTEASLKLSIDLSSISKVCKNKLPHINGYRFQYV